MNKRHFTLILGLLAVGLCGPLAAASGPGMEQRIERLERRVARITDLTLALDAVREENRRLRGEVESLQHQIEQLKRKQRDIYMDIDQRLSTLKVTPAPAGQVSAPAAASGGVTPAESKSGTPQVQVPAAGTTASDTPQMQADYKAAYALLSPQVRRYQDAAKAFSAFLKKYPRSSLAPNAQYWLGESYYVSQKNAQALAAFNRLVSDYPGSPKVPGALYKIGRIHLSKGDSKKAADAFRKVVDGYPSSPAAGLAREQLNRIQKGR